MFPSFPSKRQVGLFLSLNLLGLALGYAKDRAGANVGVNYAAVTDWKPYAKPPLPNLEPAGFIFKDPAFGSRILRLTDGETLVGSSSSYRNASFSTPLYGEPNAWNSDGTLFCIESGRWVIPFRFDRNHFKVSRLGDPSSSYGGLVLDISRDATFSYNDPNILYVRSGRQLRQYDFKSGSFRDLINLAQFPGAMGWPGPLTVSTDEKLCIHLGGAYPDTDFLALVYDVNRRKHDVLDTRASTLNGKPLSHNQKLGWLIHYAWIDKSGRYVVVMSTGKPYLSYLWDLKHHEISKISPQGTGRKVLGYGWMVSDARPPGDWGPQWLLRSLKPDARSHPHPLLPPHGPPGFPYQSLTGWNHAQENQRMPLLVTTYHDEHESFSPMPLGDEIFALATDGSGQVWRFAHHRNIYSGAFQDLPESKVSQDGRYYLFTSNWENTLGPGRQDVFLLELGVSDTAQRQQSL